MRLFVAAEPAASVRTEAARIAAALQRTLRDALATARVRWVPVENLHLTVWFLGEVPEPRVPGVLDALAPPLDLPPFRLALAGLGAFPPSGSPRALWLGVREGRDALTRAHGHIGERLRPLGFEPEQRKFSAHLTLARVNSLLDGAEQRIIRHTVARERADAGACTVDALTVFRSRTAPSGAVYEPLLRVPLK